MTKKLLAVFSTLIASVAFAATASLTGTWNVEQDIAGNASTVPITFKQEGEKLVGTMKGPDAKELPVKGEVKGDMVNWEYATDYEGNPLTIKFSGKIDASGKISGSVEVSPMGVEGTFTAKKPESKPEEKK